MKLTIWRNICLRSRRFDERISTFAEQKFRRDGIEVQTGCRVLSVDDKEITMKAKSTGVVSSLPHGLIIWSTGISTLPVIRDFMEEIGQVLLNSNFHAFLKHSFPILSSSLLV
jgi:NADH dehydrogenase FAD-containing subunit